MDFRQAQISAASPSPSSSASSTSAPNPNGHVTSDPMTSWWESISKARSCIHLLSSLLSPSLSQSLSSLADSDRPALSLLTSPSAYSSLSQSLSQPSSGFGNDPLCQWLYDTYLSGDAHLRLVVLSFIPLLSHLYLSLCFFPTASRSLAGFEAVLLAVYSAEVKSRGGKPVVVSIPDLSQPSLYHTPRTNPNPKSSPQLRPLVGVISPPLEPQTAVKSTKRACIVGVALDCYFKKISEMPFWSKLDFCKFLSDWAGQDCPCKSEFDPVDREIVVADTGNLETEMGSLVISENGENGENGVGSGHKGTRIPLPWEILQPVLRILGHCLLAPLNVREVKEAAGEAVRCLYARASHDLAPQAILATRSLIQLDKRAREAEMAAEVAGASSAVNTPSKAKKPEVLLVSK